MTGYLLFDEAGHRLDEIIDYTREECGEDQAIRYFDGFLACFDAIAERRVRWRTIPASFGAEGYFCRYQRHFVYWRILPDGTVGIVTILHERMQQMDLLREAFES